MIGTYNVYEDGELVATSKNVITTEGQEIIMMFLAGERGDFGNHMAFGIGESSPAVTDTSLDFEYHKDELDLKQSQVANSKIVLRGTIPDQERFSIYEIGIVLDNYTSEGYEANTLISTFDGLDEAEWTMFDGTTTFTEGFEYAGGRIGTTSFQLDVPASSTWSLIRNAQLRNLDDLLSTDTFAIAYETLSGTATNIEVRFRLDESNYRSYSFVPSAGFNVHRWDKSEFNLVGTAGWNDLLSMEIIVTSSASGADIIFEGLRYDMVTGDNRPVLVSRTLLPEPLEKRSTSELQVEYVLNIGFSVNGV